MEFNNNDHKIILACNKYGLVEQVFLDTATLLENVKLPVGLNSIVSPMSIRELGDFWMNIQKNSIEENTILTLNYNNEQMSYIFSGYALKNTVLLCGNTVMTSTGKALEEIMLINNEQANHIRLTEKKTARLLKKMGNMELNEAFLNDFSAINNELMNSKRELVQKNQKIELLNKELHAINENMNRFTYSVSHDLREPLRMVNSFLALLHRKYQDNLDKKGLTYLNMAIDGGSRLSRMLSDLLDYHRNSDFDNTESVDLNNVILEVEKILQEEIKRKDAKINSDKLPVITGSSVGYQQVFQNLISNAIKFVPVGKKPVVSIHVEENDSTYIFKVKDNGIGIPENQKNEVFKLFKRLNDSRQYEGTGVGLAMVKKSIEWLGGEIWLDSTLGDGTTFFFTIPKT